MTRAPSAMAAESRDSVGVVALHVGAAPEGRGAPGVHFRELTRAGATHSELGVRLNFFD